MLVAVAARHLQDAEEHLRVGGRQVGNHGNDVGGQQIGPDRKRRVGRQHRIANPRPIGAGKVRRAQDFVEFVGFGLKLQRAAGQGDDSLGGTAVGGVHPGDVFLQIIQAVAVGVVRCPRFVHRLGSGMSEIFAHPRIGNSVGRRRIGVRIQRDRAYRDVR